MNATYDLAGPLTRKSELSSSAAAGLASLYEGLRDKVALYFIHLLPAAIPLA